MPGESKTLRVATNLQGADAAGQAIRAAETFAAAIDLPPATAMRLAIIVEELVLNIVEHGGIAAGDCVEMSLASMGGEIGLVIEDPGTFFDPRTALPPGALPPERGGGAGLAMVQAWGRVLSYAANGGINRLEMIIPIHET